MKALVLRRTFVPAVAVMVLTLAEPLMAAPLYETSFDGTVGTTPADWTATSSAFVLNGSGDYTYGSGGSGISHYTGALTNGELSSSFTNGTVVSNFRKGGASQYTGLIARRQSASSYYAARLYSGQLQVYRFGGSGTGMLASAPAPGYDTNEPWRIEMSLLESQITSTVFDQTGAEIATVTVNNSEFSDGTAGVRSNPDAAWEDFQMLAPEGLNLDVGLTGQQVQAGFQAFTKTNNAGSYATSPQSQVFASDLGLANQVSVELSCNDRLGFRDRTGTITHALGDLVEDFVFAIGSDWIDLKLQDLKPGRYQITTYHHDLQTSIHGTQNLLVSDATRTSELVASGLPITNGTAPASIGQATFSFIANGVDPVVVRMDKNTANLPIIDGFEIAAEETLNVDIGCKTTTVPQNLQADFFDFARQSGASAAETISSTLGVAGSVDVTVSAIQGWRDRGDMPDSIGLAALSEDFAFSWDRMQLTLDDLVAGQYTITTYHHDYTSNWADFDIDVDLSDAFGLRTVATDISAGNGATDPSFVTFNFLADGINPVVIGFTPDSGIAMLNGFSLARAVPEPSSLSLLALGLLGLCMTTGRRKRA